MTRSGTLLLIVLTLFGLAACSTSKPLLNPDQGLPPDREYSQVEVQHAIISALQARGWRVGRVDPTQIYASISVRQRHHASVVIEYSPIDFKIRYRSSQGLDYEEGTIHRNYNRWINNLRAEILHQLNTPKTL